MICFEEWIGYFFLIDLGRIVSYYYIKYNIIEIFNEFFDVYKIEGDIFVIVFKVEEFD